MARGDELVLSFNPYNEKPERMHVFEPGAVQLDLVIMALRHDRLFSDEDFHRVQPFDPAPWPEDPLER